MLFHRCPWCGERITHWTSKKCSFCQNPIIRYRETTGKGRNLQKLGLALLYIMMIAWIPFTPVFSIVEWWNSPLLCIALFLSCILACLGIQHVPYAKAISQENEKTISVKPKVSVALAWEKHQSGGLFYPRIQVSNGEIFFACFRNTRDQTISTDFIVLEDIIWTDNHHCNCNIRLVRDSVLSQEVFPKASEFYLYYDRRKIAQGNFSTS